MYAYNGGMNCIKRQAEVLKKNQDIKEERKE